VKSLQELVDAAIAQRDEIERRRTPQPTGAR